MKLKYTIVIETTEENYRDLEDPDVPVTKELILQIEKENIDEGMLSWDEVLEDPVSVEVEVIDD